jgi:4-amino-4-deoxy-L-arabinose transferase-like glycosyltransferase
MRRDFEVLTLLSALLFLPFLGGVHLFDWDEINFAECAREMIRTGDYLRPQIDYEPFWEKPPLFLWMQAASMHLFGVNEFAARFPNAICGWLTILLVFYMGQRLHDRQMGWIWALTWMGSILPHLYFRSGIIDPWFNLLIFIGLCGFIGFRWQFFVPRKDTSWWQRHRYLLLGGWALGLAVMTKGPTAYLIVMLTLFAYWGFRKFKHPRIFLWHMSLFSMAAASVGLLWFMVEFALHGGWFIKEFIAYQIRLFSTPDAGHQGFLGYHMVVLLIGCFPVSLFALPNLWGDQQSEEELIESDPLMGCKRSDFATWMQILFWVVLILFTIVQTKIVHYSSLCYFPLTYLGALTIWRQLYWARNWNWIGWAIAGLGTIIGLAIIALPVVGQHTEWLKPLFERDHFALQNLEAVVHWDWWRGAPGFILLLASVLGCWLWVHGRIKFATIILFGGGAVFMFTALICLIGQVEQYSQRAAIEFYESKANEDCYVRTAGFKSFGYLFYTDKRPVHSDSVKFDDLDALIHEPQTKPVYIVAKWQHYDRPPHYDGFHELYRKNGFVFFQKDSPKHK